MLPDKPTSKSWVTRGLAVVLGVQALGALGVVGPGFMADAQSCLGLVDWQRLLDLVQMAGGGGVLYGFRGVLGRILVALQKPAI